MPARARPVPEPTPLPALRSAHTALVAAHADAAALASLRPRQLHAAASWMLARELLARHLRRTATPQRGPLFDPPASPLQHALAWLQPRVRAFDLDLPADGLPPRQLGELHAELLHHAARKSQGAWFTTDCLTQPTAARTLAPLLTAGDPLQLRICDPAAGSGAFLLAALDVLADATGLPRAELARRCLFGLDLDPVAAALAAWSVWQHGGEPDLPIDDLAGHVRCGDGLLDLPRGSFDAVLGNPPWETLQPNRKEFFADLLSDHRAQGHQQAKRSEAALLQRDPGARADWDALQRACSERTAQLRPLFQHQGRGKLFTYRLFVEQALHLLRAGGRLGLIVPASLGSDCEAAPLRRLLFEQCRWEWLFVFENRRRLFAIDSRYRFGPLVAQKGGRTEALRAAFGREDPAEWQREDPPHLLYRDVDRRRLSPRHGVLLELQHARDLDLLGRMAAAGEPVTASLRFAQGDLNMTSHSHRFVAHAELEARGAVPAADGHWQLPDGQRFAPLYQGAMVYDLHPHVADHAGGAGHRTRWQAPRDLDVLRPQFFVAADDLPRDGHRWPARAAFRALSNATNERTVVACLLDDLPCGNSLGLLSPACPTAMPVRDCAFAAGVLGSLSFDWAMRQRLCGTNLNGFVLEECVLPRADATTRSAIARLALRLSAILPWHERLWQRARSEGWIAPDWQRASHAAREDAARQPLRTQLDVLVARAYGLGADDLMWMLRGCDLPVDELRRTCRGSDPRGFWRIDRRAPPPLRHPVRVLTAMRTGSDDAAVFAD